MTASTPDSDRHSTAFAENPKILRLAGGLLFFLGILSFFAGYFMKDRMEARIDLALSASLFLALGYPLLLYVGALKRIGELETRISGLEAGMAETDQGI